MKTTPASRRAQLVQRLARLGLELPRPLTTRALLAQEAQIGGALPTGFRRHVQEVADGGPGPNGGLWTVNEGVAHLAAPADATRRFPITAREVERLIAEKQTDESTVLFDEERPLPLRGVIPVADEGDGLMVAVVTQGKRAGQLWLVGEAWTPLLDDEGAPLGFDAWWSGWLEACEASAPAKTEPQQPAQARAPKSARGSATKPRKASSAAPNTAIAANPAAGAVDVEPTWPKVLRRALAKPSEVKKFSLSWDAEPCETEALPDVFAGFTALEQLNLSNSYKLSALPPSLSQLGGVKKVWLTSLPALRDIELVAGFAQLEFLNVSRCRVLRALPEGLGHLPELRELLAMFTGLQALPESLGCAPKLKKLWLQLSFQLDMAQAWPVIARMPALTHLSLAEGRFSSWPAGPLAAPPALVDLEITRAELPKDVVASMRAWPSVTLRE